MLRPILSRFAIALVVLCLASLFLFLGQCWIAVRLFSTGGEIMLHHLILVGLMFDVAILPFLVPWQKVQRERYRLSHSSWNYALLGGLLAVLANTGYWIQLAIKTEAYEAFF